MRLLGLEFPKVPYPWVLAAAAAVAAATICLLPGRPDKSKKLAVGISD